jgi:hypothetical protein
LWDAAVAAALGQLSVRTFKPSEAEQQPSCGGGAAGMHRHA